MRFPSGFAMLMFVLFLALAQWDDPTWRLPLAPPKHWRDDTLDPIPANVIKNLALTTRDPGHCS